MDGHGMEVVRYIWLQKIANVTLVATRSCNTHIQMLSLNGSRILQKGFHHMRCNILSRWLATLFKVIQQRFDR